MSLQDDLFGLVPVTHLLGRLQIRRVPAIEVLEDTILVLEPAIGSLRGAILDGREFSGLGGRCRGGGTGHSAAGWESDARQSLCGGRRGRRSPGQHREELLSLD